MQVYDNRPLMLCIHLVHGADDFDYVAWFNGKDWDSYWVCTECASKLPDLNEPLIEVAQVSQERLSRGYLDGVHGTPEIRTRTTSMRFEHRECKFDVASTAVGRIHPNLHTKNGWFVLQNNGDMCVLEPDSNRIAPLFRIGDLDFEIDNECGLSISPKQDFAALYQAKKSFGCVIDLRSGKITTKLNRGGYRPETSHYPVAFFESNGRTLLVTAIDWNRLDIVDPTDGKVLTQRGPTMYSRGEPQPGLFSQQDFDRSRWKVDHR
ncbi:MAG TPA: hypothetical protein V6C76_12965 [Drouetiella sp.]